MTQVPAPGEVVRAIRIDRPGGGVAFAGYEVPDLEQGEVLLRSAAVGICGSDVDLLVGGRPDAFTTYPVIPGHEWSAVVAHTGRSASKWSVGDRVAVAALMGCGECGQCRGGGTNLCEGGYSEFGFTRPGGLAEYVAVPERQLHRLPEALPLDLGPLLEPTAVMALALRAAPRLCGRTVAVVGDGTLGQLAAQLARVAGAGNVAMFGMRPDRLILAERLGADCSFDVAEGQAAARYRSAVAAGGAEIVFECGGSVAAVELALAVSAKGAHVVLAGVAGYEVSLTVPSDLFVTRSLTVAGVVGSTTASWGDAGRLAATGRLRLEPLVSHRFGFEHAADAYAVAVAAAPGTRKVVVTHDGFGDDCTAAGRGSAQ